jgi:phosphopantetheine adenylyltransferase
MKKMRGPYIKNKNFIPTLFFFQHASSHQQKASLPHPSMDASCLVAGTFDVLHAGHYLLLHAAFHSGHRVEVWLCSDALCAAKAVKCGQALQPYSARAAAVEAWVGAQTPSSIAAFLAQAAASAGDAGDAAAAAAAAAALAGIFAAPPPPSADPAHPYAGRYSLHVLRDATGPAATEPAYTTLACSEETRAACEGINARRTAGGLAPLRLVSVPVLCKDGRKLSSTQERAKVLAAMGGKEAPE